MLVDIFSRRYEDVPIWERVEERDLRLLAQAFSILEEDMCPYYRDGKEVPSSVKFWTTLHSQLSRELGVDELSPRWSRYRAKWNGNDYVQTHERDIITVCKNWMKKSTINSPDMYIKERLSLIELGFRKREEEIESGNASLEEIHATLMRPDFQQVADRKKVAARLYEEKRQVFQSSVDELNTRFRQAGYKLNYHNGFIQMSDDELTQLEIEKPFWSVVSDIMWKNVDIEMKEALDRRDSGGRDSASYAARALESTIKIISDKKDWTTGNERGAHNYIDNLLGKRHAFITPWERDFLKSFFSNIRNSLAHGAGSADIPFLPPYQTQWAIEFSMIWIKLLIRRFLDKGL